MNLRPATLILSACLLIGSGLQAAVAQTTDPVNDQLYVALGGKTGIRSFTHVFMVRMLNDDRIKARFEDADIDRLEGLLAEQFCDLAGGPCKYSGKDMSTAHAGKNLGTADFNALAEDLQIAMEEAGVSTQASNQLIAKLAPMYHQVVTR